MKRSLFSAGILSWCAALPALAEIEIHDAYARAASPNAKSGAAFMVIYNHGGAPDRLIGAQSDVAARVQLHTHEEDANGVMRMLHVEDGFDLPTDGRIALTRGGHHVMMMGLNTSLEQGDTVSVTLTFENAGDVVVDIPVDLERQDSHGGHGHHGDQSGHGAHAHGSGN